MISVHVSNLNDWFLVRDYPQKGISKDIDIAFVFVKQPSCKDTSKQGVTFVQNIIPNLNTNQFDKKFTIILIY